MKLKGLKVGDLVVPTRKCMEQDRKNKLENPKLKTFGDIFYIPSRVEGIQKVLSGETLEEMYKVMLRDKHNEVRFVDETLIEGF